MPKVKHVNSGNCKKCDEIFDRYPGFYQALRDLFKGWQRTNPSAHIACAGRGEDQQEAYYSRGASRAHYGESAHNYNCAIDVFGLVDGKAYYGRDWYDVNLVGKIPKWVIWYGQPGSPFFELAHFEVRGWRELAKQGALKLVE